MKRLLPAVFLLMLTVSIVPSGALEADIVFHTGNLGFSNSFDDDPAKLDAETFFFNFDIAIRHRLSETFSLEARSRADPVLRNSMYTALLYRNSFVTAGTGPVFGVYNTDLAVLKPGVRSHIRVESPSGIFLGGTFERTLNAAAGTSGDYEQELIEAYIGFMIPDARCSFIFSSKRYLENLDGSTATDLQRRYMTGADLFAKNIPVRVGVTLGYESLDRIHDDAGGERRYGIGSVVTGMRIELETTRFLTALIEAETAVLVLGNSGLSSLSRSLPGDRLFRISTGASIRFDTLFQEW